MTENACSSLIYGIRFTVYLLLDIIKTQLFVPFSKSEQITFYESKDSNYHYICECGEDYVGMRFRQINHRIHEHQQPSWGGQIFEHTIHYHA